MRSVACLLVLSWCLEPAAAVWGQAPAPPALERPTFSAGVTRVTVGAVVRDPKGRVVTSLGREDFTVYDGDEPRPITDFQIDPMPVSVALLIDTSGSMTVGPKLRTAREAGRLFLSTVEAGKDEAALFAFDSRLQELRPFTTKLDHVRGSLEALEAFGTTSLYDAIADTGKRLAERPGARRAIMVVTDGIDTSSRLTAAEVSGLASSIDVPVYVLATVAPVDRVDEAAAPEKTSGDLRDLARWTGGELFLVHSPAETTEAIQQVVTELRHQYLLAIEPREEKGWHRLVVRTRHEGLSVRARSGYWVAG
jgi:VWFA-related protein